MKLDDGLPQQIEVIAKSIVHSAYKVHKALGPGLLESVYEICFHYELTQQGLTARRQVPISITYGKLRLSTPLRLDVIVENCIVCELKAVEVILPVHKAQLLSYLRLANCSLGFLINFNVPLIKEGIKRMII